MMQNQQQGQSQIIFMQLFEQVNRFLTKAFQLQSCKKEIGEDTNYFRCAIMPQKEQKRIIPKQEQNNIFSQLDSNIPRGGQILKLSQQVQSPNIQNTNRAILFERFIKGQQMQYQQRKLIVKNQYGDVSKLFQAHKSSRQNIPRQLLRQSGLFQSTKKIEINLKTQENQQKISLIDDDIQKLKQNSDLNDAIIEAYIKIMKLYIIDKGLVNKLYIYSTYFLSKLLGDVINKDFSQEYKNGQQIKRLAEETVKANYNNIKRWNKNEDIFSKEILVFPINFCNHWNCIIVLKPSSLLFSDSQCEIIYCDSMFQAKQLLIQCIRFYLKCEIHHKKGLYIDINSKTLPSYQLLLPRQPNHHDCGLYMLLYIEQLLINWKKQLFKLNFINNRHKLHLFPYKMIMTMRYRLTCLFLYLSKSLSSEQNQKIIRSFLLQKKQILNSTPEFYQIDKKQYEKFLVISNFKKISDRVQKDVKKQYEFMLKIRFYLDPQINYYDKSNLQ